MKAGRHGATAMPWPSTDNEMKKRGEMMMIMVEMGIVGIIIGESEKKKGKKSRALPKEKKGGKNRSNHPDDEPAGGKNKLLLLL